MPLHLPPSVSVENLVGGYNSNRNFTNLADNQTNDARNVEITNQGSIKERNGYSRRYKNRLINTSSSNIYANGEDITGHFQLVKLGIDASSTLVKAEIVAAGNSLYCYSDTSATAIATGLVDNSLTFWDFTQIQDPRSATNDIVVATNGRDAIKIWDGQEASAANLSSVTSATQVPVAKFIASLQNRLYALNIQDNSDIDSKAKVLISTFDTTTGTPRPQRFDQSFIVGGSDQYGEITGKAILNDQLIIFKRNATYKFIPGSGRLIDTAGLIQMDQAIGCLAPGSIATVGNTVLFLNDDGIYAFDGTNFLKISDPVNREFRNTNRSFLQYARGVYYRAKNQYWIAIPTSSAEHNDMILIFDLDKKIWFPPFTNVDAHMLSHYRDTTNDDFKVIIGDHKGYLYQADNGTADRLSIGYDGYIDSESSATYTDSNAAFETSGNGLAGLKFQIITGDQEGASKRIVSNTSNTITLESPFDETLVTSDRYVIGAIDSYFRTKDFAFGYPDLDKKFRQVTIRGSKQGNFDLITNYIIDFKILNRAGSATVNLISDGLTWDYHTWDDVIWDGSDNLIKRINLRPLSTQGLIGKYLALRFTNKFANQPWEIFGFDVMLKQAGRRRY